MSYAERKPIIYEINTWVWLTELSRRYRTPVTLANVPEEAVDEISLPGLDMIWMMGVWQRSEYGRQISLRYKHEYVGALPDVTDDDLIGSAYAIGDYRVDDRIGGRDGLARFREQLARRGLKLMLDFVPNHVAADHRWVFENPEYIMQGTPQELLERPGDFFAATDVSGVQRVFAHGRDPYFPGWIDTAQLNAFEPRLRQAVRELLLDIASQCDGVRCDMAMLLMTSIFSETWKARAGSPPHREYWVEMISAVRQHYPDSLFVAEVYWNREYDLLVQGFDYCYDKVFYDRVVSGDTQHLRQHLVAEQAFQQRLIRFIENHDEPRAWTALGQNRSFAAATLMLTLPGAALLHQGQFTGRRAKLPVQIRRGPTERQQPRLQEHYLRLLRETREPVYHEGDFYLFHVNPAGPRSSAQQHLLAYGWQSEDRLASRLIVVNLTDERAFGRIDLSAWEWLKGRRWRLYSALDGEEFIRQGGAATRDGLYLDLEPYQSAVLYFDLEAEIDRPHIVHPQSVAEVF